MSLLNTIKIIIKSFDVGSTLYQAWQESAEESRLGEPPPELSPDEQRLIEQFMRRCVVQGDIPHRIPKVPPPPKVPPQPKNRSYQGRTKGCEEQSSSIPSAYADLGVVDGAPEHIVRAAYKAAARKAHPDSGGSTEQMAQLNKAFELIERTRGWKNR